MNRTEFEPKITELGRKCEEDLRRIGIQCGNIVKYQVLDHIREWGLCIYVGDGRYFIDINYALMTAGSERGIKAVMYHELLHTLPGCIHHNAEWKQNAAIVTQKLGYDIKMTSSCDELGFDLRKVHETLKYRYALECLSCGKRIYYKRKCKSIEYPYWYRCAICGGYFHVVNLMEE